MSCFAPLKFTFAAFSFYLILPVSAWAEDNITDYLTPYLRVAVLAAGRNLDGARCRVPGEFRPFDVGFGGHR